MPSALSSHPIYLVCGDKGGVGKSMVSVALVHHLAQRGTALLLIETDTSNPDVWRCYEQEPGIVSRSVGLDDADGWITLVNLCETHPDHTLVINTAARNNTGIARHGDILNGAVQELNRALVALWVINRQRDSVALLKRFLPSIPTATVHVLRNLYFGDSEKFELYNQSALRQTLEARGGRSLDFPDLADRVADDLISQRLSIARALRELPLGNRAELRRWEKACAATLGAITELDETDNERDGLQDAAA